VEGATALTATGAGVLELDSTAGVNGVIESIELTLEIELVVDVLPLALTGDVEVMLVTS
jgi:hypothetical protein